MTSSPHEESMTQRQYGATILKPILAAQVRALATLLQAIGDDIDGNPHIPFARLGTAHFMSWFIVEKTSVGPLLFLEINVDGPIKPFLNDLVTKARAGLDLIFGHCAAYPPPGSSSADQVVEYLLASNIGYDCLYIGWRGLTVDRILRERDLRARLEAFLDQQGDSVLSSMKPSAVRALLQKYVASDPTLDWAKTFPPRPFLVRFRTQVLLALKVLGILALVVMIAAVVFVWHHQGPWPVIIAVSAVVAIAGGLVALLRKHEKHDWVSTAQPDHEQVADVVNLENRVVQNHMVSVSDVKPGPFRWLLLKSVLKLVQIVAAVSANQGNLSGITSIHFARWVVIDAGKKLLFLSNYDGSWENYLDDFIDQASIGLTAIWSNTNGFPRSYYLIYGGAQDELLFKTLVRQSQAPSLVWYSAYPDLSVQNIQTNATIREGLFVPMTEAALMAWLANF
jgi:hypothetical protein